MIRKTSTSGTSTRPDGKAGPTAKAMSKYIAEIDRFVGMLNQQQVEIRAFEEEVAKAKSEYEEAKCDLNEARSAEHNTVSLFLRFVRPGSSEILPLFDRMEPADEERHGKGAKEWRKEPITSLDLSAFATRILIDGDVLLIGQLQDVIQGAPETWHDAYDGLSPGMAEAIRAKLQNYILEHADE